MEPKTQCDKKLVRSYEVNFLKNQIKILNFEKKELQQELLELKFILEWKENALKKQEELYANAIGSLIGYPIATETIG